MADPSPNHALDHESRVTEVIVILSVACTLSTLVVAMRCYSRAVILQSFGLDDALIIPAQILTIASAVAIGLEAKYGLGRHVWMMPPENYIPYMKSFYSSIVVYNVAVCLTKISILLQYRRIFSNTALRKIIIFGLGFLICWGITLSFLLPLSCIPVHAFWNPEVKGFCLNHGTIWYIMAGVNVVTDFTIFSMPIPVISSLHLPTRQKAMLLIVFTLGIFPCAVSIYRIRTLVAAANSSDPTWDNIDAATFSFLELSVGVVAVCLPTIRPVLAQTMPRIFGSLLRSTGGYHGHHAGGGDPTGGRGASRTLFGRSTTRGGKELSSAARGSLFTKGGGSMLRESESTEELREGMMLRSRAENDIEFGDLNSPRLGQLHGHTPGYSVTVVAGWDANEESGSSSELMSGGPGGLRSPGIKKTTVTVVTQKVAFPGEDAAAEGSRPTEKEGGGV